MISGDERGKRHMIVKKSDEIWRDEGKMRIKGEAVILM